MNKFSFFKLNLLMLLFCSTIWAAQPAMMPSKPTIKDAGVPLNSQVPEISATNIEGKPQTIKQLSGENGLILVLFRSADWCPYCKRHLLEINQWNSKLNTLGYKVAAISYDSIETLKKFSDERALSYPLLADQNHKTMIDLNVLNDEQQPGDDHFGIPFPGVMVIDTEGKLSYKYFYKGYKHRVKMDELYKLLESS